MATGSTNANWTHVQSGSSWVAKQLALAPTLPNATGTRTIQFSNVTWSDNSANDATRASKGSTIAQPPAATSGTPSGSLSTQTDPAFSASAETITPSNCNTNIYSLGGTQNVVMQHGLNSSSCTWTRMANWLNQDFRFGKEVIPSLSADSALASQGQALVNEINSVGGTNNILMGHSQGGLISRYASQYFQNVQTTTGTQSRSKACSPSIRPTRERTSR
jgi:hypothetical protein